MKKNIIDLVIKYGSCHALWLYESISNGSPLRVKRLDNLEAAYFKEIMEATREIRHKEV